MWDHKIYESAVIFVENVNFWNQLTINSKLDSPFPHQISFLMICENLNETDTDELMVPILLNELRGTISIFQYYLRNETSSLDLFTIDWYTEKRCSKNQRVKLNSFDKKSKTWNKNLVIIEKFKNFNGCMLTIRLGAKYMMTSIDKYTQEPIGPIVDLFKAMAHVGNFTYNYQLFNRISSSDATKNIEDQPKHGMIMESNIHLQKAIFLLSAVGEKIHFLTSFREEKVSCVLTPGEPYDSYAKLIFPFDYWTWIFLLVVFGCTFFTIFLIAFLPCKLHNIVYGENVMTPALNVGAIFFGMSQTQVSFRNFPRIILITYILFCLVMRTAYQGVLFELIAADIRKPLPKTFHDLYMRNYTIHTVTLLKDAFIEFLPKEEL